jgi:hypothetical protein
MLILTIPFCCHALAQESLFRKRSKIKNRVEKYYLENNRKYITTETDSTLTFVLNDSLSLPATYIYYFDKYNRCKKQETVFNCDSCLQKGIKQSIEARYTRWIKVGNESYYSTYPYRALMEPITENGHFIIRYTSMNRKDVKSHE